MKQKLISIENFNQKIESIENILEKNSKKKKSIFK